MSTAEQKIAIHLDEHTVGSAAALVSAWDGVIAAAGFESAPITFQADVLTRAAIGLQWQAATDHSTRGLDRGLAYCRRAVGLIAPDDERVSYFLFVCATLLLTRHFRTGAGEDLDASVAMMEQAVSLGSTHPRYGPLADKGAAGALFVRFDKYGVQDDLDRAVTLARRAVDKAQASGSLRLSLYLGTLGEILYHRFGVLGTIDDLQQAIQAKERQRSLPDLLHSREAVDAGLGSMLLARWAILNDRADLDRAVLLLSAMSERDEAGPGDHSVLGNALMQRYELTDERDDLLAAVREHEAAVTMTSAKDWRLADRHNNAGNSRLSMYRRHGDAHDHQRAVSHYRLAAERSPADSPLRVTYLLNLGSALSTPGDAYSEEGARDAFRRACLEGRRLGTDMALRASREWGMWAASRQEWEEAVEAFAAGLDAIDLLLRRQLLRVEKEAWLRTATGLTTEAALALAITGRTAEAATCIERGRARLLSETLERDHADLRDLSRNGHDELAVSYRAASEKLRAASSIELVH